MIPADSKIGNNKSTGSKQISVLILAAGFSSRMGYSKAFLEFKSGVTFLEFLIDAYGMISKDVVVVVNKYDQLGFLKTKTIPTIVINDRVEAGRSLSIQLGLQHVRSQNDCLLMNVDNPAFDPELIEKMLAYREPGSYINPVYKGKGGHPVLLMHDIVEYLVSNLNWRNFRDELNHFRRIDLEWHNPEILLNINTQEDLDHFRKLQI